MNHKEQIQMINDDPSLLDQLMLGFEYDKPIQQVKRDMRVRLI